MERSFALVGVRRDAGWTVQQEYRAVGTPVGETPLWSRIAPHARRGIAKAGRGSSCERASRDRWPWTRPVPVWRGGAGGGARRGRAGGGPRRFSPPPSGLGG